MKKILALMLALMLACGCALTAAEETQAAAMTSFTAVCKTEFNQEALENLLGSMGMDETTIAMMQMFLPLLTNLSETVVVDDNAMQLDVLLKDTSIANLAAKFGEENIEMVSSLIPSYKLTLKTETVINYLKEANVINEDGTIGVNFDTQALMTEAQAILEKYTDQMAACYTIGEPEAGEFQYDDIAFNVMVPADVDVRALATVVLNMEKELMSNETIASMLSTVGSMASFDVSKLDEALAKIEETPDEELPTVDLYIYYIAEDGVTAEKPVLISFDLDTKTEDTGIMTMNVLSDEAMVSVDVIVETIGLEAAIDLNIENPAELFAVNVLFQEQFYGLTLGMTMGETVVIACDFYYLDAETPLLSETVTIIPGGEVTASFDEEGKTVLALDDAETGLNGETVAALLTDLQSNGLGLLLNNAMQAMPEEIGTLVSLFMGGASTTEEAPVEEAPVEAAEEAPVEAVEEAPAANE